MELSYSAKYAAFRNEVRAFIEQYGHLSPKPGGGRKRPDQRALSWQRLLVEKKLVGRWIPAEYGGGGMPPDILENAIISDEMSAAGMHMGIKDGGTSLLIPTLLEVGTEEQRQRWIGPTLRGEVVWCQGYSEPNAGSDLASLRTSAALDGDQFILNGSKIWTTSAHFADMMFLLCRTEQDKPRHDGLSYLLLSMKSPGVEVRPIKTMTGRASYNEVFFTNVRVPLTNLVGKRGDGWKVSVVTLRYERLLLGEVNKLTERLQRLKRLMTETMHRGRPLISDPVLCDRFVRLQAEVMAWRYHDLRLLTEDMRKEPSGVKGMIVKLFGSTLASRIAALGVDALGVAGLNYDPALDESEAATWYGDYMYDLGLIIGGGSSQIQRNIIGERGLGFPREARPQ